MERPRKRGRTAYAAVPLEPWSAEYPGSEGVPYDIASLVHIEERLEENITDALEHGVLEIDYRFSDLYEFVKDSLNDAQYRRINFNNAHALPARLYPTEEYIDAALEGTATPEELLRLMLEQDLPSIELAKLSHPFDFDATRDMNTAVLEAEKVHGFTLVSDSEPRYKPKRIDRVIGAMVMVRKDVVATKQVGDEVIEIVRRSSLLLLDGEESDLVNRFVTAAETEPKDRTQTQDAIDDISIFLTKILASPIRDELTWLFPTTTSFYVRRRPLNSPQGLVQEA